MTSVVSAYRSEVRRAPWASAVDDVDHTALEACAHHAIEDRVVCAVAVSQQQREREQRGGVGGGRVVREVGVEDGDVVRHPGDGEQDRLHDEHAGHTPPPLHDALTRVARILTAALQRAVDHQQTTAGQRVRDGDDEAGHDVDEDDEEPVEDPSVHHRRPHLVAVGERAARGERLEQQLLDEQQRQHDDGRHHPDEQDGGAHVPLGGERARPHRVTNGDVTVETERRNRQHVGSNRHTWWTQQ